MSRNVRFLVHVADPFRPITSGNDVVALDMARLLEEKTVDVVRRTANEIQREWYIHGGQDFTFWKGYSLGEMMAGPALRNELLGVLGNFLAFSQLLSQYPEIKHIDIRHDPGIVPAVWQRECEQRGICFRLVQETEFVTPTKKRRRRIIGGLTKHITGTFARVLAPYSDLDRSLPLVMLLSSGSLTGRHREFCAALESSPHMRVVRSGNVVSGRKRRQMAQRISRIAVAKFANQWEALHVRLNDCEFLADRKGSNQHVISVLHDTYLHRLPEVAATTEIARSTFETVRPELLIAEAQAGNEDYIWSRVAKSLGIAAASITNEMFVMPRDAYNFAAASDFILVESPVSRPWWIAKGFAEASVLPARARFLNSPTRKRSERDRFVVLCALKRYVPDVMDVSISHLRGFLKKIICVARKRPDIHFVVKFHPGTPRLEGQASFSSQQAFVAVHAPSNVEVAALDSDMLHYIQRADCVACPSFSFTVFEALAHKIPCILTPPKSAILDKSPLFDAMKNLSTVTDLENLGQAVDNVRWNNNVVPSDWYDGVLYSEPAPHDVVKQVLQTRIHYRSGFKDVA